MTSPSNNPAEREQLVLEGRFWLPHDRYRSYGRLEFDFEHGLRLHLVETNLTRHSSSGPEGPDPFPVLHGESLGGQPLTLLELFPTAWSVRGSGPSAADAVDCVASTLLRGAWVSSKEEISAPYATIALHGLKELLTGGQVDAALLHPARDQPLPPTK